MNNGPDGGVQQPVRPPIPPVPPQGSSPPGSGGRGALIAVLVAAGVLLIVAGVGAVALITSDDDPASTETSTETADTEEQDVPEDMTLAVSQDSDLQLQVPKGWDDLTGELNPVASIEVGNKFDETYAIVISDAKEDFAEVPSPEEFADGQLSRFTRGLEGTEISEGVSVDEYDPPAIRHEVQATIDNLKVVYIVTFLETESSLIQVFTWTLASEWEANRDLLEDVSNSLQELATG